MPLRSGVCRIWDDVKGFGFITPDDGSKDFFCHRLVVDGSNYLNPGDRVEFNIAYDKERKQYKVSECSIVERVEGGAKAVAMAARAKLGASETEGKGGGKEGSHYTPGSGGKGGGAYSPYGGAGNPYPWRVVGKK